jgi:hypothetical protein
MIYMACAAAISAAPATASAQSNRDGIVYGPMVLKPSLEMTARYDDNIFLDQNGEVKDVIFRLAPSITGKTNWNRHEIAVKAGIAGELHAENQDDDSLDANVGMSGRYDISRAANLRISGEYRRRHDNRGTDNANVGQQDPTVSDNYQATTAFRYKPNKILVRVGGDVRYSDFHDAVGANDDDRDRVVYGGELKLGYELPGRYVAFVEGRADRREFSDRVDDLGLERGSSGYRVRAGVEYRPSAKLSASIGVGYLTREFDENAFSDISGYDLLARVNWEMPNRLTNVSFIATRSINDSTSATSAGILTTALDLGITHNIGRAWEVGAGISYATSTDEGAVGSVQEDDDYGAGLSLDYNFNRYVKLGVSYDYERRISNVANEGHTNNVFALRLKYGY